MLTCVPGNIPVEVLEGGPSVSQIFVFGQEPRQMRRLKRALRARQPAMAIDEVTDRQGDGDGKDGTSSSGTVDST